MIVVTGTKRAGTSMWMQVLKAAGLPVLGEAFPRDWGATIRDANAQGFYESSLRHGVYFGTNPNPRTGAYLFPEQARRHAVKIFAPGVVRSERSYLDRVICTVRPWREYVSSMQRLQRLEREARPGARPEERPAARDDEVPGLGRRQTLAPELEWWLENYALILDAQRRRYALHVVSYDAVLATPAETLGPILTWVGGDLALDAAVAVVSEKARTQRDPSLEGVDLPEGAAATFDALYGRIHEGAPLEADFVARMNRTHQSLLPLLRPPARKRA